MKNKNTNANTDKQTAAIINDVLATEAGEKLLVKAMDKMFTEGKWEIPDDAIIGIVTNKVNQLQAQVGSLTQMLVALSAKIEGKPVQPSGRVDAIAATKVEKKK